MLVSVLKKLHSYYEVVSKYFINHPETKELLVSMKFCQKVTGPYVHYGTKLVSSKYTSVTSSAGCKLPTWVIFFFFFFFVNAYP